MFKFKMLTKVLVAVIFLGRVIELNLNLCIALSIDLANPMHRFNHEKAWQSRAEAPDKFLIQNNEDGEQRAMLGPLASQTLQSASLTSNPTTTTINNNTTNTIEKTKADHQQDQDGLRVAALRDQVPSTSNHSQEHAKQLMHKLESNGRSNYFGTVLVGEKQVPFVVLFDLSSSGFWLPSSECKLKRCLSRQRYNSSQSASYKPDSRHMKLAYDDGTKLEGRVSKDSIQFAGVTLEQQAFCEITHMSNEESLLAWLPVDGFMGLGFKRQLKSRDEDPDADPLTPLERMYNMGLLKEPIFSLQVRKDVGKYEYSADNGELLLGEMSNKYKPEELTYVPVTHANHWEFHLTSVNIRDFYGTMELEKGCESACPAVLDTRFQLLGGHFADVDRLNRAIGGYPMGNGLYRMSHCDLALMPYLIFNIGGTEFALAPEEYVDIRHIRGQVVSCFSSLVVISSDQYPYWILGEYFLKRHYVTFDFGKKQIGFARSKTMPHQLKVDMYGRIKRKLNPVEDIA